MEIPAVRERARAYYGTHHGDSSDRETSMTLYILTRHSRPPAGPGRRSYPALSAPSTLPRSRLIPSASPSVARKIYRPCIMPNTRVRRTAKNFLYHYLPFALWGAGGGRSEGFSRTRKRVRLGGVVLHGKMRVCTRMARTASGLECRDRGLPVFNVVKNKREGKLSNGGIGVPIDRERRGGRECRG